MSEAGARIRIGELSRRVGVGTDRLRAWERRYGLMTPERTRGGFRLYSGEDEQRVRAMQAQIRRGLSAAQAARAVLDETGSDLPLEQLGARLAAALDAFDDAGAHRALDRLLAGHGAAATMREVVFPYLHALGEAWACAETDVGHEHFASNLLQARLLGRIRSGDDDPAPRAVLACPPGEQHTLGLVGVGVALSEGGWRVTYLGADTPIEMVARAVATLAPRAVVVAATMAQHLPPVADELSAIARAAPVLLGGAGVTSRFADHVGARFLDTDPVTAAELVAADPGG